MEENIIIKNLEQVFSKYTINISKEGYISLLKEENGVIKKIYAGNLKNLKIRNLSSSIIFNNIEQIINKNYKIGENNPTIDIDGHNFVFNKELGENFTQQLPIDLSTKQDLDKACELISKYIKEVAEPFFAYWQDIRSFLPFLETNDISFLADMFCGDAFYKKAIIWKLCSHPKYKELTDNMLTIFSEELKESPKDKLLQKDYKQYLSILKRLENTTPLYDWDERYLGPKPFEAKP